MGKTTKRIRAACVPSVLIAASWMDLDAATEIPAGGTSIIAQDPINNHGFWAGNNDGPVGSREIVSADHPDFDQAIRVTVENPNGAFFNGQISFTSNQAVENADVLLIRVFFRSISTEDETGTSFTTVYPQSPGPSFTKYLVREISGFKEDGWQEFLLPFQMTEALPAGDLTLLFGLGGGAHPQSWEIGGVELLSYKKTKTLEQLPQTKPSYLGREEDAPWRKAAAERIEQYRKGPMRIHIFDANGNPVPEVEVDVKFQRHAYHFGSAVTASRLVQDSPTNDQYRAKILELFNEAGPFNAFKWPAWAGDWGKTDFGEDVALNAAKWMKENGLYTRAHVMVWPSERHLPNSMKALIPDGNPAGTDPAAEQAVLDHIKEIGAASVPFIDEWDVINEPFDNHDLMDAFGNEVMVDWFNEARSVLPTQPLYLNDYSILSGGGRNVAHQQHYEDTIQFLLENDAPIDAMGMQGHFNNSPTPIDILWEVLERYSNKFPDLDIRITEFTVDTADEAMQADYLRDFFTLLFSHPKTVGIQHWGFWDAISDNNAALYRNNWEAKPNAEAYRNLVFGQWWNDFIGQSNNRGFFAERGFFGDYAASATLDGIESTQEFSLQKGSESEFTLMLSNAQAGEVPINNGNFETGDIDGWTVTAADEFEIAPNVAFGGTSSPYFPIEPTVGNAVLTLGLKGQEIGTILVEQLIKVPDLENITLSFDYRGAAQLLNAFSGTPFDLHIERENGEPVMTPIAVYHPSSGTPASDSGIQRRRVNLEKFRGQTLRIRFSLSNNGSGDNNYTFVMLDNVVLAPYLPPTARLEVGNQNQVLVGMSASDHGNYQLESSKDLEAWEIEGEFDDLDLKGSFNYVDEDFSGGAKFYRMREL